MANNVAWHHAVETLLGIEVTSRCQYLRALVSELARISEKYPQSFQIDELRCIYCGMCEEACPVDAIELTSLYNWTGRSREEMIYEKEKLLSIFDATKDKEPMSSPGMGGTV
jgi:formate hydrogenlyase subunit 6/NADH:ubiquinone oxidoreductase subunit I